jgi:hypothetical protein
LIFCQPTNNFTFQVRTSQALMSYTTQNEWFVNSECTHHMEKDATLFTILNKAEESRIYVVDDFYFVVVGHGDVAC